MAPAENEFETLPDGVVVPAGTLKPVAGNQYLLYNEFIVYRLEQVKLRYLVALDFQNVAFACNNKFYMVQLVQDGDNYMVFRKWGRVGAKNPQRALERYNSSLEKAQASFTKKFLDKSGNEWPLVEPFERVEGKYVLVELDNEEPEEEKEEETSECEEEEEVISALHETVQDVLKLSAALQEIEELKVTGTKQEAPTAKLPGTRRSSRVKRVANPNAAQIRRLKNSLKSLSSDFYTLIPHDFGRNLPPPIDSMDEVKLKIDLLEVLANIEISQKLQTEKRNAKKNAGAHNRYVETTHAPTHVQYKLRIKSVLKVVRPDEEKFKDVFQSVDNHKLLWHGSRMSNVVGILSKGLRVAPPEAPNNGYMFGKGIYFADSVSKSANYCWTTPQNPKGVLILAEVALGNPYEAQEAEDLTYTTLKKTKGCDSTHGVGRMAALEEDNETMADGVVVPIGEFTPSDGSGSLLYNEFIVYRQEQVKLRYLVTLDFLYEDEGEE
uniref:Poly [ADP-ribose] polymerase n=1 Tax=Phytophthora ramorum TaxID=164328 RepID=H3H4R1_PHYRM